MSAADVLQAGVNVVSDPCLPQVAGLLNKLHDLESGPSDPNAPPKPTTASLGIGLCKAVKPLQAVIFLRENPWVGGLAIAGFLGVFVGIGYRLGQRSGRRSAKKVIDV